MLCSKKYYLFENQRHNLFSIILKFFIIALTCKAKANCIFNGPLTVKKKRYEDRLIGIDNPHKVIHYLETVPFGKPDTLLSI